jgi:hypothetical protein
MSNNTIQIKRNTSGAPSSLNAGELAVNLTDKKLWVGNNAGDGVLHLNDHLPLAGGTLTGDLKIDRTSNASSPVLQIENDADHVLQLGVVRSAAGTGPNTGIVNYPTAGLRIIKGTGTDERARFDSDGALLINTTSKGSNTAGKLYIGSPLATSSAIAQISGLVRLQYLITHSSGTGASDHSGIQPNTNNTGNVGNTDYRYYGGYFNVGSFSNSLLVNADANGGYGTIENRQAANTNANGIATVNTGTNSLRLWVDGNNNRIIGAGSTNVFSFDTAIIKLLKQTYVTGGLLVNATSDGGFGKLVNKQTSDTYSNGISTVSAGGNSLRLWVDSSGNRKINSGSTEVISFTASAINLLQPTTFSGEATFADQDTRWTYSGNKYLRSDQAFYFLHNSSGSAQRASFGSIQVSDTYSGTPPTNGILFGTDTTLYRSAANTFLRIVTGKRLI